MVFPSQVPPYRALSFAGWLWLVIAPVLGLKRISDVLDTNSTNRHCICQPHLHHTPVTTRAVSVMYSTLQERAKILVLAFREVK